MYVCIRICVCLHIINIQGGENPKDASSCRSFFVQEPLIIGLFCGKWLIKIRHPMSVFATLYAYIYSFTYTHTPIWYVRNMPIYTWMTCIYIWHARIFMHASISIHLHTHIQIRYVPCAVVNIWNEYVLMFVCVCLYVCMCAFYINGCMRKQKVKGEQQKQIYAWIACASCAYMDDVCVQKRKKKRKRNVYTFACIACVSMK